MGKPTGFIEIKRAEWEDYRAHIGPWELRRYGDA